jgi:hypothetical protein
VIEIDNVRIEVAKQCLLRGEPKCYCEPPGKGLNKAALTMGLKKLA